MLEPVRQQLWPLANRRLNGVNLFGRKVIALLLFNAARRHVPKKPMPIRLQPFAVAARDGLQVRPPLKARRESFARQSHQPQQTKPISLAVIQHMSHLVSDNGPYTRVGSLPGVDAGIHEQDISHAPAREVAPEREARAEIIRAALERPDLNLSAAKLRVSRVFDLRDKPTRAFDCRLHIVRLNGCGERLVRETDREQVV